TELTKQVKQDMEEVVQEWLDSSYLTEGNIFVIGCSISEDVGEKIETAGSEEVDEKIYDSLQRLANDAKVHLAFQCCEHLNRSLEMERDTMKTYSLEQVTVIPSRDAGGSMATYAYKQFKDPVVVENIQAHAGIDIGETMI